MRKKQIPKIVRKTFKFFAKPIAEIMAFISRKFVYASHCLLHYADWCIDNPEYYNHDCDLYWNWEHSGNALWVERGVYNILALQIFENPVLVELCCGEGFNTKYFYSIHAKSIFSCDFCKDAIKAAKRKYQKDNIDFEIVDIRDGIPETVRGDYPTNVIWDAAIEHFTEVEIENIMKKIHSILSHHNGILSGYTIKKPATGKGLEQHEYEFTSMDDLKRFFTPYFKNVKVFETIYPTRTNYYFWASDGELPFTDTWEHYSFTK